MADLARAKPLFYSRNSSKLEDFLYVPDAVIVSPATFERTIVPAFRAARARLGSVIKSLPTLELDVLVERSRLHADPATALAQTKAIARSIDRIAPRQDYLIDNISNTLEVARDDAVVGKRMFVFLGLPGHPAGRLSRRLCRQHPGQHGAARTGQPAHARSGIAVTCCGSSPTRRWCSPASAPSSGPALGFLSVMVILGRDSLFEAAAG